ncbi:hypothetical protein MOP88_06830 [Sphingomonas sp. WKB10]|nr:hypothetical protein [Sphingomonas sp. WKB10]
MIGEAVPIASISRAHCRDMLDVLRFLPANAGKLFPKLSPREAADRARLRGDVKVISAGKRQLPDVQHEQLPQLGGQRGTARP